MSPDKSHLLDQSARNAYNNTAELEEDMSQRIEYSCGKCEASWFVTRHLSCPDCHSSDIIARWVDDSSETASKRAQILDTAKQYVTKDRNASHGEPEDTFSAISGMWSAYLGVDVEPHDVCAMMALLKVARAKANPMHDDSWVDIAGYAACGAEVAK